MSRRSVVVVEAHSGAGGPPTTLLELVPELSRRYRVMVAIPPGRVAEALRDRAPAADLFELPAWTRRGRFGVRVRSLSPLHRALVCAGEDAIIHVNGKSALNLVGPLLMGSRRRTVLVHFHDSRLTPSAARNLRTWKRLGVPARYAAVSRMSSDVLRRAGLGSSLLPELPNPIEAVPLRDPSPRACEAPFRIAWAGTRHRRKGLDVAIRILGNLDSDVQLDIFGVEGSSPFISQCRDLAVRFGLEDRIAWLGRQPDFRRQLVGYDAALVTSRQESFGRVALEAMAAGVPVAAGLIPGVEEAVGAGNAQMFDLEDVASGARAIEALREPDRWWTLRERGLQRASELSPARVCDLLERRYEAIEGMLSSP